MARFVPWPTNARGNSVVTDLGLRADWPGRTIAQSAESGRAHLIDRGPLRWAGSLQIAPTNDRALAQRLEQALDLLVEPDSYTHLPPQGRRGGFFDGLDAGTGGAKVTVKAIIPQADGLYVLLSPTAKGRTKDAVDGRFGTDPAVGDYFQVGERMCRVGGVKYGAPASAALVAAATAAASRPAILVEPAIALDWEIGEELKQTAYVRARITASPLTVASGKVRRGTWQPIDWVEYIPEAASAAASWNRLGELQPFTVPVGGRWPIRIDRLWHLRAGAGFYVEATTPGDRVSFPPLAATTQYVRGRRAGAASVTLTLYGPDGAELDSQTTTAVVEAKAANTPPTLIRSVPRMSLDVGETQYVDMPGVVEDADDEDLDYRPSSSNGAAAFARRYGDRVGVTGTGIGNSTVSVLTEDPSGGAVLLVWEVDVAQVGSEEERAERIRRYRAPPAVPLRARPLGSTARAQSREYDGGDYFEGPNPFRITVRRDTSTVAAASVVVRGRKWRFVAADVAVLGDNAQAAATFFITATDTRTGEEAQATQVVNLSKGAQAAPVWVDPIPDQTIYDPDADPLRIGLAGRVVDPDGDAVQVAVSRPAGDSGKLTATFESATGNDAPGFVVLDRVQAKNTDGGTVTVTVATTDGTRATSPSETFDVDLPAAASAAVATTDLVWAAIPDQRVGTEAPVGGHPALDLTPYLSARSGAPEALPANTVLSVVSSDPSALRAAVSGFSVTPIPVASDDIREVDLRRDVTLTVIARRRTGSMRGAAAATVDWAVIQHNRPPRFTGPAPSDIRLKVGGVVRDIDLDTHSDDPDNPPSRRRYTWATRGGAGVVDISANAANTTRNNHFDLTPVGAGSYTLLLTMQSTVGDMTTEVKEVSGVVDAADASLPSKDPISHTPLPDFPESGSVYPGDEVRIDGTAYWGASGNSGNPREYAVQLLRGNRLWGGHTVDNRTGDIVVRIADTPAAQSGGTLTMRARARGFLTDSVGGQWVPPGWDEFNIVVSRRSAAARPTFRAIPIQRARRGASSPFTLSAADYADIPAGFGAVRYSIVPVGRAATATAATINAATGDVSIPMANALSGQFTYTLKVAGAADERLFGTGSFQLVIRDTPSGGSGNGDENGGNED